RQAPRSPVCPYTTLFRSENTGTQGTKSTERSLPQRPHLRPDHPRLPESHRRRQGPQDKEKPLTEERGGPPPASPPPRPGERRPTSEGHTSELQARENLVC